MSQFNNPFKRNSEEKKTDTFTIRLNEEERINLERVKKVLQQEKDSTAYKQLASIGANVLFNKDSLHILDIVVNNNRRNKRLGIIKYDIEQSQM